MGRLTEIGLKALSVANVGQRLSDGEGLFGTVRTDRNKSRLIVFFEYRYRSGTRVRSVKCGTWPEVSLREIRRERDAKRLMVADGLDPAEENRIARLSQQVEQARERERQEAELARLAVEAATRRTVAQAIEQWYEVELSRRKDGGAETRRAFTKDVLPAFGALALTDLRRSLITNLLDDVVRRGARTMANRLFGDLRQFFRFCVDREWIGADPSFGLSRERVGGREKERERVLSPVEIVELRDRLPTARLQRGTELAVWILLGTCARVGELSQASWEDVDLGKRQWRIPPGNSKNAKEHRVHLSEFVVPKLAELRDITGGGEWLYPATGNTNHIDMKSLTKQLHDRQRLEPLRNRTKAVGSLLLSGGEWTPHDLRRTGATLMSTLGVSDDIVDRCLNHVEPNKLRRVYIRSSKADSMQAAWDRLGDHLGDLIAKAPAETVLK